LWETLTLKADLGVPEEVLWEEAGYTKEDIAKFKKLAAEEPPPGPLNPNSNPADIQQVTNGKQAPAVAKAA